MSISERLPATKNESGGNPFGDITPHDPTKVAGFEEIIARFDDNEAPASALNAEYIEPGEASPSESTVETSSTRLGNMLRRGADAVDSTAERFDDTKDRAKKKLGIFGRAALRATAATSEFAVGASFLAGKKGLELADRADAALFDAAGNAKDNLTNKYNSAADKTGEAIMNGFAKVETGMDKAGDKMISLKEGVKEKLAARKSAALARKQARRERWSQRVTATKESISNGLDRSAELAMAAGAKLENGMDIVGTKMVNAQEAVTGKVERTKASIHTTRAIGRAAFEAALETRRVHAEQNQL